jgi:hypothetical protein
LFYPACAGVGQYHRKGGSVSPKYAEMLYYQSFEKEDTLRLIGFHMKNIVKQIGLILILAIATSFNHTEIKIDVEADSLKMCSDDVFSGLVYEKNSELELAGKCYGYVNCTACTNCSRCGHCNSGGRCGVCSRTEKYSSPFDAYIKREQSSNTYGKSNTQSETQSAIRYNDSKYDYSEKLILEKVLTLLGYDVGYIDGIFDGNTIMAIKKFQKDYGLTPDGKIGQKTLDILEFLLN